VRLPTKELVALNGKPVTFFGMEWDYGGTVSSLNGGKLDSGKDGAVKRNFRLDTRESDQPLPDNAYPVGDSEFSSDDAQYPRQGELLVVGEIAVSFPEK